MGLPKLGGLGWRECCHSPLQTGGTGKVRDTQTGWTGKVTDLPKWRGLEWGEWVHHLLRLGGLEGQGYPNWEDWELGHA